MNIHHFFVPHKRNNHRAKLLHNISLLILIVAIGIVSSFSVFLYKTYPDVLGISYQISEKELLNLTNYERAQKGLPPLSLSKQLTEAAKKKAEHMFLHNYWAHFAPDGTSPWDIIRGEGYNYSYAGENLAKGFTTSYDAVKAWMNSTTHRENILSKNYEEVGFAIVEGRLNGEETVLIVQEFGSKIGGVDINDKVSQKFTYEKAQVQGSYQVLLPQAEQEVVKTPAFDIRILAKSLTFIILSMLLTALILDFVIIEKKKIPRVVGNNLDHILLITIFVVFLFMARLGHIV